MKNMPDWLIRSLKTFVQTFFGVLIPALAAYLSEGFPEDIESFWIWLAPIVAAALSASISAAWNIILEHMEKSNNVS